MPPSPLQHYWSLSIEEQFYFVWPWLLAGIFLVTRKVYRRGHLWARHWGLFGAMSLVVAGSFSWAMYLTESNPNAAYFSTFTRVWELGVGALVAIAGPWLVRIPDAVRPALAYFGLIGILASLLLIDSESLFPAPWAALPVLSTAVVIVSFYGARVHGVPVLTNPVARWFGDTSYTLYLWHWPVIILLPALVSEGLLFYLLVLGLALGLTALTYHYYEDPIRKSQWLADKSGLGQRRKRQFGLAGWSFIGVLTVATIVTSILYIEQTDKLSAQKQEIDSAVVVDLAPPLDTGPASAGSGDTPALSVVPGNEPCYGAPALINDTCVLRNPEKPLQPSIENFATETGGPYCFTRLKDPLMSCKYGYEGPDAVRIALVGDSHAGRVLHGIAPYLESQKWHLTTFFGQGCVWKSPPIDQCAAMPAIEEQLAQARFDLVLTTSTRTGNAADYLPAWKPVLDAGSRIVVIADNPKASEQSIACLTRINFGEDRSGECGTPRARATPEDPQVIAANRLDPPIPVIDLTPYYCTVDNCPSVVGDVIVYADISSHITPTYMRTVAPALVNGIRRSVP
ncbi:acyltransferase family protein [Mycolicibacterium gilvum]